MKNTVTMAELMQKVNAYGQPQNLDEGFASDASRRAAFAQGYKAKGKKDKKEETLDEKLSTSQIGTLKKTFEPLRGKKIGPNAQKKLLQIMDKLDRDKDTLGQLVKADIPFVTQLAITRLISKHNMKAPEINKLREEENCGCGQTPCVSTMSEEFTMDDFAENEDNNYHTENALELAKKYGSRSEIMRMEKIKKDHDRKRSISEKDQKERDAIIKKYYPKLKKEYGSSPYDRQYEETELEEMRMTHVLINMQGKVQGYASNEKDAKEISRRTKSTIHPIKKPITDKTLEKMNALQKTPKELKDLGIIEGKLYEMAYKPGSFKDTRPQEKGAKALADLAKTGGLDKRDYEKARSLYIQASDPASREKLKKFIFNLDTEPKEEIMNAIGLSDPNTFLQMYPNAKRGQPLTTVSFAHRNMKSEQPKFDDTDKQVAKAKATANKMVSVAKAENLDLVNAAANVLGEKQIVNEDGHTDVASAIRQCKTMIEDAMQITSKLQTMNPEESLPSWWTNKLAVSSNSMNKLRDYFLVPTTEEVELDEKAGDIPDLKNLVGELVKASGMHLAQSKRVQAHVDMMDKANAKGPEGAGSLADLKKIVGELEKASEAHKRQSKSIEAHVKFMGEETLDEKLNPNLLKRMDDDNLKSYYLAFARDPIRMAPQDREIFKALAPEIKKRKIQFSKPEQDLIKKAMKSAKNPNMYEETQLDERQHTNVSKKDADKVNSQVSKVLGRMRFTHVPNTKGGIFKLPPNVKHEITVDRNDMKDAAELMMKDKGDIGFMFKQGLIRLTPSMAREVKEWFDKHNCDVKVREIHEGSNVYQAYVPISKTIPNKLRHLTLENQYGMIPEDVENLDNINYKNIKETSITMNGDFWNKLLTAYEEK